MSKEANKGNERGRGPRLTILGKHVDGLRVSVYGDPRPSVFEGLGGEKRALRSSPHGMREYGHLAGMPGGPLMLTTEGGGRVQFVLRNAAVKRLEVTSRGELPRVMVQFRAEALYQHNLEEVGDVIGAIAGHFLGLGFGVKVGGFDVAVDFQREGWAWPEMDDVVCRARKRGVDLEGRATTGMTFGRRHAPLQVQIYDKGREIEVHGKGWVEGVWEAKEAYRRSLPVIRAELRFSRPLLKDFGVETVADLGAREGDLIRYAVGGDNPWFRVASPETRGRRADRRGAAPWWSEVSRALLEGTPETGRVRVRSASSSLDAKRDRTTMITFAIKTAAWEKILGRPADSPEDVLGPVPLRHLPEWLEARGFGSWGEAVDHERLKIVSSGAVSSAALAG